MVAYKQGDAREDGSGLCDAAYQWNLIAARFHTRIFGLRIEQFQRSLADS